MNDGLLYLAARLYAEKAEAIRAETDAMMAEAAEIPDCGETEAEVFVEGEIALDELRHQFPQIVVDVVEGVDKVFREWDEEDRQQMWYGDYPPF